VFVAQQEGTAPRSVKFVFAVIATQLEQLEAAQQAGELELQTFPVQLQGAP
jgi:hypothetical protein